MNARVSELDGIRALAVSAVLYTHYANEASDLGHLGVRVFFVLSAFLITGILIEARDTPRSSFADALGAFYIHRAFRILPAYFLMIAGVIVLDRHVGSDVIFHALFLSNFSFAMKGEWQPWEYSALWTLSVEWQFYLFWPFVVLRCSNRKIVMCTVFLMAGAVAFWAIVIWRGIDSEFTMLITPASFDALAVGALARIFADKLRSPGLTQVALAIWATIATPSFLTLAMDSENVRISLALQALAEFAPLYPIALLICVASSGVARPITTVLRIPPLVWIGTVSYGIYLYHVPALGLTTRLQAFGIALPTEPSLLRLVVLSSVTVFVASLSWRYLEKPLQRYGKQIAARLRPEAVS